MKHTGLFLAAWFASAAALSAQQVKVEMKLDQDEFIVGEAIPLTVRIVNYSGQTLRFGDESWINYSVEALEGFVVMKTGEGPMAHNFEIETSKMATLHTDLQPYFTISQAGRYRLRAGVRIRDWDAELNADPVEFEIVRGVKLWEQEFGVPKATNAAAGEPEVRKYSLQKAMYLKHSRLYLRVTDHSEVKVIKVIPLGYVVSFANPRTELDSHNNLHLIYQDEARTYSYTVTNPDGVMLVRQTYYYTDSAPRLAMDDSGQIIVKGGVRHETSTDLPSTQASASLNDLPPPKSP